MKYTALLLVVCIAIGAASCKKQKITENEVAKVNTDINVFDATQGTHKITCKAGETFTISLEGNPSTGFQWDFDQGFDTDFVIYQGSKEESTNKDTEIVGAPNIYTWTFKALKKGTTQAIMKYQRPWEKDPVNDKTILVEVTITE